MDETFIKSKFFREVPTADDTTNAPVNYVDSVESLLSKRSSRAFPSDPAPFHLDQLPEETVAECSIGDKLDRDMQNLVESYRIRSTGSLSHPRSRSFLSLTAPPG
jgi:hypothetical protein